MAGLIPDFSSEAPIISEKKPLLEFQYDNTLDEIDGAMQTYQQKFSGKRHKILLVTYSILTVCAIVLVILQLTNPIPYLALAFCGYNLYYNLTDRKRMRKKIIEAIKETNPEKYTAVVYEDKIEIDTVIMPKEKAEVEECSDSEEIAEEQESSPIKSVFVFGQDMLDFAENEQSLLLVVAKRQTYCFPKRCLYKEQVAQLRDILKEKTEL